MMNNYKSIFWYAANGVEWDMMPAVPKIRFSFYIGILLGAVLGFSAAIGLILILSS